MTSHKTIKLLGFALGKKEIFIIVGLTLSLLGPLLLIRPASAWFGIGFNERTAYIGDTFGGIVGPLINFVSVFLIYLSFKEQFTANEELRKQANQDFQRGIAEKMLERIEKSIESMTYSQPGRTESPGISSISANCSDLVDWITHLCEMYAVDEYSRNQGQIDTYTVKLVHNRFLSSSNHLFSQIEYLIRYLKNNQIPSEIQDFYLDLLLFTFDEKIKPYYSRLIGYKEILINVVPGVSEIHIVMDRFGNLQHTFQNHKEKRFGTI